MTLTQEQITRLSKLSALNVDSHTQIDSVLDSLHMLANTDTTGIEQDSRSGAKILALRADEIIEDEKIPDELLACSPQKVAAHQIVLSGIMHGE
ncbi:MAG: Asp-tRNA(Asn)/Glu-tRNA(Gln) amidotransferase subunit GatC [Candidatus Altimarinota bacterium]